MFLRLASFQEKTIEMYLLKKSTIPGILLDNFCLSLITQLKYKLAKAQMVFFGVRHWVAGWKMQTNPLSYHGTHGTQVQQIGIPTVLGPVGPPKGKIDEGQILISAA